MRRRSIAEVLTGAVVLLVAASFLGYAVAHSGRTATSGYTLHARFDHIDGLGVGADVRLAGVKVGSVDEERIDPQTFQAVVSLSVRNDLKLPKDSAAIITSESLLGGKYLSLQAGGDETMLQPGQDHHHYPVIGQSRGTVGQVHLQHDQREEGRRGPARSAEAMIPPPPEVWPQPDGAPVSCREKLRMLAENHAELGQALQDAFEDAVLMGVDEQAMRRILAGMVEGLQSPKRADR